jgi:hypothetical protein
MTKYKRVTFQLEKNQIHTTYSSEEYDRHVIDSILYMRGYRKVSDEEWSNIFVELNNYKTTQMIVHKDSIQNIKLA